MYKEPKEEIEFISNKGRKEFMKTVQEALNDNKLTIAEYNELKELFE